MSGKNTFLAERRARRKRLQSAIVRTMRQGAHGTEAARQHGVSEGTFWRWQYSDPAFQARLKSAREAGVRRIKRAVVANLRSGKTLREAAAVAGRTVATLHFWRRKDAAFDARIIALLRKRQNRRMQKRVRRKK